MRRGVAALKVAAVVLAAGASRRLGRRKQAVSLAGETLLQRTVRVALLAGLDPVLVVLVSGDATTFPGRATALINPNAEEGMAASIRVGIAAAARAQAAGAVILTCDQPAVTADHLGAIARGEDEVVASEYAGRTGVPAYFPATAFDGLLKLRGDVGARELLRGARAISLPHGELDIDTEEDLALAKRLYEGGDAEESA